MRQVELTTSAPADIDMSLLQQLISEQQLATFAGPTQPATFNRAPKATYHARGREPVELDKSSVAVMAYRVCKDSGAPESGSIAARERRSLMRSQHAQAREPRKAFLTDLTAFLCTAAGQGHKLLICMDVNTPWNHTDIQQLKRDVGLTDLMQTANSNISPPATYDRGDEAKAQ